MNHGVDGRKILCFLNDWPEECVQSLLFQFHYNILGEGENRLLGFQGLGSIISNTQNIQCSKPHSGVFNKLLGVWEGCWTLS